MRSDSKHIEDEWGDGRGEYLLECGKEQGPEKGRDAGEEKAMINSSLCFGGLVAARVWRLQALRGSA